MAKTITDPIHPGEILLEEFWMNLPVRQKKRPAPALPEPVRLL